VDHFTGVLKKFMGNYFSRIAEFGFALGESAARL
jgi:hypothetical protein